MAPSLRAWQLPTMRAPTYSMPLISPMRESTSSMAASRRPRCRAGLSMRRVPAGYSPYNIQNIAGRLYVEYAKVDPMTHRPTTTANTGIVNVFDLNGVLLQRLATDTHLNSPWGVTLAPAGFGDFAGDILVGNFGDGTISAFDPVTLLFEGTITGLSGAPIVNSGLWALNFRAPGSGFDPNTLFITPESTTRPTGSSRKFRRCRSPARS